MKHFLIAAVAAVLVASAFALAAMQPVSAQSGGPSVCLSLPPGDHTFSAPSQDREGEVSFTVTVGDGGVVTEFTEPGGQSIPPAALLEIFAGENAYPLPEGVSFVECEAADDGMMEAEQASELCLNLDPGTYEESVSASGQVIDITIHVGEGNRLIAVEVLGASYSPAEALSLLAQFGASIPPHIEIIPCEPTKVYPYTGSGGLADDSSLTGLWAGLASLAVVLISIAAVSRGRRIVVRKKD